MIDIFKHGCKFYKFRCDNCGCEFGTDNVSIAVSKKSFRFSHAEAECPECQSSCVCFEENQPPKTKHEKEADNGND